MKDTSEKHFANHSRKRSKLHNLSYREAVKRYLEFTRCTDMTSYTFDPVICKGFDVSKMENAKEMHRRYSNGTEPLYVIGVTNHIGMPDDEMEATYNQIRNNDLYPFFGKWINAHNIEFIDISYPINHGIDEFNIAKLKKNNSQEFVLKINNDGRITYV